VYIANFCDRCFIIARMSTFCGLMKEYRLISLDRFDGINLESTVYMLSHKHSGKRRLVKFGLCRGHYKERIRRRGR